MDENLRLIILAVGAPALFLGLFFGAGFLGDLWNHLTHDPQNPRPPAPPPLAPRGREYTIEMMKRKIAYEQQKVGDAKFPEKSVSPYTTKAPGASPRTPGSAERFKPEDTPS